MNCTHCSEPIPANSRYVTVCHECASSVNVKYLPSEETIWAEAKAMREAWMFGEGATGADRRNNRDVKLGGRPRGGVFVGESDEAEKAWRRGQAAIQDEDEVTEV